MVVFLAVFYQTLLLSFPLSFLFLLSLLLLSFFNSLLFYLFFCVITLTPRKNTANPKMTANIKPAFL
ncbi:hypothetical protein BB423_02775 [Helicobacter pylori]|nr:hypothetical protein BB423_02775 [Helicobacter pylori]